MNRVSGDVAVPCLLDRDWAGPSDCLDEAGAPASESRIREDLVAAREPLRPRACGSVHIRRREQFLGERNGHRLASGVDLRAEVGQIVRERPVERLRL